MQVMKSLIRSQHQSKFNIENHGSVAFCFGVENDKTGRRTRNRSHPCEHSVFRRWVTSAGLGVLVGMLASSLALKSAVENNVSARISLQLVRSAFVSTIPFWRFVASTGIVGDLRG